MTDAATILAEYGNHDPQSTIAAAAFEHIELALAATMLEKESNGRNVWGSDPVSTGGAYTKGGPVTRANYLRYRDLVHSGAIGRQGCGPAQATSAGYQDLADQLGGCWDPVANMRAGFRGLGQLVARYGVQGGAQRYNGAGPAAQAYGRAFAARYQVWQSRLAGASIPTVEGDLTPDEHNMLAELHDRVCRLEQAWAGGVTDDKGTPYDLRLLANRANVESHQAVVGIAELKALITQFIGVFAAKP